MDLPEPLHPVLLQIASDVIRSTLSGRPYIAPAQPDPALLQPAGSFVSLHDAQTHRLRGCIGSFDATRPLLQSLIATAASVLEDPRFNYFPVTLAELPQLELELSILSPLKPAENTLAFDLLNDGIYLSFGGRTGCFLPQVARETGWNKEQLLARLCTEKLGLPAIAWKSPEARLQTFSVLIIGPRKFNELNHQ